MVDWLQTFVEFVAVVAGVLLAFGIDRLYEGHLNKVRVIEFLELIKKELDDNCKTLRYLAGALKKGEFDSPFFAVRFTNWRTFLDRLPSVEEKLRIDMTTIYYELEMHNRTVTLYRELIYAYYERAENEKLDLFTKQIIAHRNQLFLQIGEDDKIGLLKSIPPVISKIDGEIKRLSDC